MADITGYTANFETLKRAAKAGHLAVMDMMDTRLEKPQAVLVALSFEETGDISFVPLAVMCEGNPYEYLLPARGDGNGYYTREEINNG